MGDLIFERGGKIRIPDEVRRRYGLDTEVPLRLVETRHGILLVPMNGRFASPQAERELEEWQRPAAASPEGAETGSGSLAGIPPEIKELIDQLGSTVPELRIRAAEKLGQLGAAAVRPLIQAANAEKVRYRYIAPSVLSRTSWDPNAIALLIQALQDENTYVRLHAIRALGQCSDTRAVDALIAMTHDDSASIRLAAVEGLGGMGVPQASTALVQALEDTDDEVCWAAEAALKASADPSVYEALFPVLTDPDAKIRRAVAAILGGLGDVRAVKPLLRMLWDADPGVRIAVLQALGAIGHPLALPWLLQVQVDSHRDVRRAAADALNRFGNADLVCRKVLTEDTLRPQERIDILHALADAREYKHRVSLGALLLDLESYVTVLMATPDLDPPLREGAQAVLAALQGETLLRASRRNDSQDENQLLRPARDSDQAETDTLVRAATPDRKPTDAPPKPSRFLSRLRRR